MNKLLTLGFLCLMSLSAFAQSKAVEEFRNDHKPSMKLFFYESTLKMISRIDISAISGGGMQSDLGEIPPVGEMITGIKKVKFFMYENWDRDEDDQLFSELSADVESEGYESLASVRSSGSTMNVMMKERREKPEGFVIIIKMDDGYSIIDIEGYPNMSNVLKFSEFLNNNSSSMGLQDAFR